jgi:hypothetical protein
MFDGEPDIVTRVIRHLRRPVSIDPALDARVMREIAAQPVTAGATAGGMRRLWPWLALAAAVAALLVARPWSGGPTPGDDDAQRFVLVAPSAASVALVGDFNDWDPARTPMQAADAGTRGVWSAVLPLSPGRYRYAFLIDGAQWRADPNAPAALDDGFGAPSSVLTVGGGEDS